MSTSWNALLRELSSKPVFKSIDISTGLNISFSSNNLTSIFSLKPVLIGLLENPEFPNSIFSSIASRSNLGALTSGTLSSHKPSLGSSFDWNSI